jgi:hypothetical protein
LKLRPDLSLQRLGRIRGAVIYGAVAWESFADLYSRQGTVARGLGAGLFGVIVSLAALGGALALLRWWYSWYLDRRRPTEAAERVAAFQGLAQGALAYLCLLTLADEAGAGLPGAWGLPLLHLRYELALAGAAWLSVGPLAPLGAGRAWLKAWALGAVVLGLTVLAQALEGMLPRAGAWDLATWLLLPPALSWAFAAGAWPLASRAFGRVGGAVAVLALFTVWAVQPARWSALHGLEALAIGAAGSWVAYTRRPGIR